jgi:hypothetical protein
MKKLLILLMLVPTSGVLLLISKADAANDESEIQQLLDKWPHHRSSIFWKQSKSEAKTIKHLCAANIPSRSRLP